MKARGWRRIGIVLSVIWVIVGSFWGNTIGIHEGDFAKAKYDVCVRKDQSDLAKCTADFETDYKRDTQNLWLYVAILAFVPILIAWGCVAVVRWVRRGFVEP